MLLVGAGIIARQYAAILKSQSVDFICVSRGHKNLQSIVNEYSIEGYAGGVERFLSSAKQVPNCAIVAVQINDLHDVVCKLISNGVSKILIEKPGGVTFNEVRDTIRLAKLNNTDLYWAYNRRFYSSVLSAIQGIKNDGGVSSFSFEFNELSEQIGRLSKPVEIKQNWLLANSSHVIDMAFYMGGWPKSITNDMDCIVTGSLDWHSRGDRFAGAGISENGALFSYKSDWSAPGRWKVEVCTKYNRYIFSPLEELTIMSHQGIKKQNGIPNQIDTDFKPGFYRQVKAFLSSMPPSFGMCAVSEMERNLDLIEKISGYADST